MIAVLIIRNDRYVTHAIRRYLDCGLTGLGGEDARAFACALRRNESLRHLDLSGCHFLNGSALPAELDALRAFEPRLRVVLDPSPSDWYMREGRA